MKLLKAKYLLWFALVSTLLILGITKPSRPVLLIGRFHPLIVHLPIGVLIFTFFMDIYGRIKRPYPKRFIQYALAFSAFFAILSCVFGYFLSLEGGYEKNTLNIHFWLGVATAVLITGLLLLSQNRNKKTTKWFFTSFIVSMVCLGLAGHYGSILTHGSDFLTQYAKAPPKTKIITNTDSLKIYEDVVFKILDDKCLQCHNPTKRKAGLVLSTPENILKGGENGRVIKKGNANESLLFKSLLLPLENEGHMPPEGKPQLTKDELWLIRCWIDNQADFENKVVHLPKNDTLNRMLKKYLVFDEIKIEEASLSSISDVENAGFKVMKLVPTEPQLRVKFQKGKLTEATLKELKKIREQIVELDLGNTPLSDEMASVLKAFKNLKKLNLSNTDVTDAFFEHLYGSERLKSLNLYDTGVTEKGLGDFLGHVVPEHVYVWKTSIDKASIAKLESEFGTEIHQGANEDFVEISPLEAPAFLSDKNLFKDTLSIGLVSKIKGADIRYSTDGTEPDSSSLKYKEKIFVDASIHLKAVAYKKGWLPSKVIEKRFFKIKHQVEKYTLAHKPNDKYPGGDKLFNLKEGSTFFRDGNWVGFLSDNLDATIDFEAVKPIDKISVNCLESTSDWIFFPKKISVYKSDRMDSGFKKIGELHIARKGKHIEESVVKKYTVAIPDTKTRYLMVVVENYRTLPKWHEGAGSEAWLFVDEILVR